MRGVEQDRVARLELRPEGLQEHVGTHDRRCQADLLWGELLENLRRDAKDVLLLASQKSPRCADGRACGELRRLRQHEDAVLLLEIVNPCAHLLDPANAGVAQADVAGIELGVHHGIIKGHGQHAHKHFVMIKGLLDSSWLRLHLHWPCHRLPIGICLRRAQDVLDGAGVVDGRRHLRAVVQCRLHEVPVRHHHLGLVALP
mmetsp:Transcript_53099/g.153158  ORF Transcript_53099/g.153158 Transcript_53099/m.153158 type:complete len:201 (-) Transcript_53099:429-1031(-)